MREITLPWPPSVNGYWRSFRGRQIISKKGREYRAAVLGMSLADGGPLTGRLALYINAYPPDKRRRDLDNMLKAPLDALAHAGVYKDDSQIDALYITRKQVDREDPRLELRIEAR